MDVVNGLIKAGSDLALFANRFPMSAKSLQADGYRAGKAVLLSIVVSNPQYNL